jgi:hypothetical protein
MDKSLGHAGTVSSQLQPAGNNSLLQAPVWPACLLVCKYIPAMLCQVLSC